MNFRQEMSEPPKESSLAHQTDEKDASVLSAQQKNRIVTWFELYRLQIFWTLLYTLIVAAIFAERAYCTTHLEKPGGLNNGMNFNI